MRRAAASPAGSGTGWLASTISIRSQATAWPCRVTTSPSSGPGQFASKARAIAADALPAPTTTVRPATGAGMCAATARAGSAAASAASNKPRRTSRIALFSPAFTRNSRGRSGLLRLVLAIRNAISYRPERKGQRPDPLRPPLRRIARRERAAGGAPLRPACIVRRSEMNSGFPANRRTSCRPSADGADRSRLRGHCSPS